jgi:hypothetical protein
MPLQSDFPQQPPRTSTAEPIRRLRVFLCHSSGDKPAVRSLYHQLRQDGFQPWLDEESLLPGQDWDREIEKAVRASDVVIVCISHRSVTKEGFVQKEIKYALDVAEEKPEGTIFIIPVRLEDCPVPDRLRRWHWVNLFDANGNQKLQRALRERQNLHEIAFAEGATEQFVGLSTTIQQAYYSQDKRGIAILAELNNFTTEPQQLLGWRLELPDLKLTLQGGPGASNFLPGALWWEDPPFVIEPRRGTGLRAVFFPMPPGWESGLPAEPLHATLRRRQ